MMAQHLLDIQRKLEEQMSTESVVRIRKDITGSSARSEFADSKSGSTFVRAVMNMRSQEEHISFLAAVTEFMDVGAKKIGKHLVAAKVLASSGVDPSAVAFIATKTVFNVLALFKMDRVKRTTMCLNIARSVEAEARLRYFADDDRRKNLLKKLMKDFDRRTYPKEWRKRTIKNYFDAEKIEWSIWDNREAIMVGYALLHTFIAQTGLCTISSDGTWVLPSDKLLERFQNLAEKNSHMFMLYQPMVVRPRPWSSTNMFRGGYLTHKVRPYPFIKGSRKRDVERLSNLDLTKVITSVNSLQETPWRVNWKMLDATKWAYHEFGGGIGKMVKCDDEPLPPLPHDYETNEEAKKAHNRRVFELHDANRQSKSGRIAAVLTITLAEQYRSYGAIYFPHNLDSRGRAYPITAFLNPQGADYVKGLLEFSRGIAITNEEQACWLAIAGANAYGNDKVSLQDRVDWVTQNEELIFSVAKDYKSDLRWMKVSEPFQFLRFCLEWSAFVEQGYGFMSHMVIPVDATNSGLQHYSAMLRDEIGGRSVNLVPGLPRADIYGDVAHRVVEKLMEEGTPDARDWITVGIDRKVTKRQVMVVPYAGKFSSCMSYTREALHEKLKAGVVLPWDHNDNEEHTKRVVHLSKLIWQAIDETVVRAKVAMTWLSKVSSEYAKAVNKSGLPVYDRRMTWLTPDGFEVVHFREDTKMNRVETYLDGRTQLSFYEGTGKLDPKDMALAVAPNFVHALDATHLRLTIIKALPLGIRDFGMVHDSFGVHAALMPQFLNECVKPAFVEMYEQHDVIQEFADKFKDQSALLPTPEKGSLDLRGVLQSEFFFS